jgi:hypothetical protein
MKKYPSLKPGIWGAVTGAAAISVIGFSSFGWTLGSTAERMAREQAHTAVVAVLAPICVEKFQHQADAATKLNEFKKGALVVGPTLNHREGWLGDNAGNRCSKLGGRNRLLRTTGRRSLGVASTVSSQQQLCRFGGVNGAIRSIFPAPF